MIYLFCANTHHQSISLCTSDQTVQPEVCSMTLQLNASWKKHHETGGLHMLSCHAVHQSGTLDTLGHNCVRTLSLLVILHLGVTHLPFFFCSCLVLYEAANRKVQIHFFFELIQFQSIFKIHGNVTKTGKWKTPKLYWYMNFPMEIFPRPLILYSKPLK